MKELILKHNGHEAHVPYELPDSVRCAVFIPERGMCEMYLNLRAATVVVTEVFEKIDFTWYSLPSWMESHDAVLEQAGDVVRTFLEALPIEASECRRVDGESDKYWLKRLMLIESSWRASTRPSDMAVLSTIAEMALLESDLHTADLRLPDAIRSTSSAPPDPSEPNDSWAHDRLMRFIHDILVPRAQDLATAAAKRREAEWHEEQVQQAFCSRRAERTDLAIDIAKERA